MSFQSSGQPISRRMACQQTLLVSAPLLLLITSGLPILSLACVCLTGRYCNGAMSIIIYL